jgi:uncharacterized repeat protein (TIGR03803 family)
MSSKKTATIASSLLCGVAIAALLLCVEVSASAQTWTVIHSFTQLDGAGPVAGLTRDAAGNFYGTTSGGGWRGRPTSHGTVFKLTHTETGWVLTTLHLFNGLDGDAPNSRAIFGPDGALYGTTYDGGSGYGTVYRLQPPPGFCHSGSCPWTATVLHAFQGGGDGAYPGSGDLAFDQQGNIYGTAVLGGNGVGCNGYCGLVFKLTRSGGSWSYSVIYSFKGGDDGENPDGGVVRDASGNLYGTTVHGGGGDNGVIFELTPSGSGWTESVLYTFTDPSDGALPDAGLIFDCCGNLYGTTPTDGEYNAGTVYELSPSNGGWNFTVLASVPTLAGSGSEAKLAMDDNGNLYGTAWSGLVFKLTPSGNNWVLTQLGNGDLGISCSLVVDSNGVVYGTDPVGGDYNLGSVFEIMQ